jgi:hypothetical protein
MPPEIPQTDIELPTKILFSYPVSSTLGARLQKLLYDHFLPRYGERYPDISITPLYSELGKLIGVDFGIPLTEKDQNFLLKQINMYLAKIQQDDIKAFQKENDLAEPISFAEMLGTYRVRLDRYFIPIIICVAIATVFAWVSWNIAQIQIDGTYFDEETTGAGGAILNGLIPVVIGACSITIILYLVKKKGLNVFRVFMGFFVLFYDWIGFTHYVGVFTKALYPSGWVPFWYYILYLILNYGSIIFFIIVGIFFFKNKLNVWQKNTLVLMFGIFFGSIMGTIMPTLSMFILLIFLSIWDIIAVFKGPLGKLADIIMENRSQVQEGYENALRAKETSLTDQPIPNGDTDQNSKLTSERPADSIPTENEPDNFKGHTSEIEIELGSGDLIFYSALVAHVFVRTGDWFLGIMVILGVFAGAYFTIQMLITKKRVLPALPFSMFLGIGMYLFGLLLKYLYALL